MLPYALALKIQDGYCNEVWSHPVAVKAYTMGLFIFQYALPLLVITLAYIMVAKKLRDQAARIERNRAANGICTTHGTPGKDANLPQPATASEVLSISSPPAMRFSEICQTFSDLANQKLVPSAIDPPTNDRKEFKRLQRTTKVTKMLVTVVVFYAICMLPNQVVWLWYEFGTTQHWPHFNKLLTFGSIMVYINSCVNPLLYAGMNEDFRKGFSKLLVCKWKNQSKTVV